MNDYILIGALVVGMSALLAFGVNVKKLFGKETREISNQPLKVQRIPEFATKDELARVRADLEARILQVEARTSEDFREIRERLKSLNSNGVLFQNQLNEHTKVLYAIAGKLNVVTSI